MSVVVDFETTPGGATNTMYILQSHWKRAMSIHTLRRRAPAIAEAPAQKCIRLGASVTEAYLT